MADELELDLSYDGEEVDDANDLDGEEVDYGLSEDEGQAPAEPAADAAPIDAKPGEASARRENGHQASLEVHSSFVLATPIRCQAELACIKLTSIAAARPAPQAQRQRVDVVPEAYRNEIVSDAERKEWREHRR